MDITFEGFFYCYQSIQNVIPRKGLGKYAYSPIGDLAYLE